MKELRDVLQALRLGTGQRLVLATLVRIAGSSYRRAHARALIGPHGTVVGAISGGCLEADVTLRARDVLRAGKPRLVRYDLRGEHDLLWGHALGCEGVAEVLLEPAPGVPPWLEQVEACLAARRRVTLATAMAPDAAAGVVLGARLLLEAGAQAPSPAFVAEAIEPPLALWVFGAGQDARALARLAWALGLEVSALDPAPARATHGRFPWAQRVEARAPQRDLSDLGLDGRCAAVLMTHNYHHDRVWLGALLASPVPYIGLLGPHRRAERLLADQDFAIGPAERRRVFGPVGLDVGAESPDEIALAILAEVKAVFAGRRGGHLRERRGALHENAGAACARPA